MIKNTLYAKYIQEREGLELIETESSFLTFGVIGDECFIANIYVEKESRSAGLLPKMISDLMEIAKARECKFVTGSIRMNDAGRDRTIRAALKVGFKTIRAEHGSIIIAKEVT